MISPRIFAPRERPRMERKGFSSFLAGGAISTTGLPRLVTMMCSPEDCTSSMSWRHFALNSPAGMVRILVADFMTIVYDHEWQRAIEPHRTFWDRAGTDMVEEQRAGFSRVIDGGTVELQGGSARTNPWLQLSFEPHAIRYLRNLVKELSSKYVSAVA